MGEPILISDLRGGRNGVDPPTDPMFPSNQCVEALNVDFSKGAVGATRGGSDSLALLGGTDFGTGIRFLCRHVPSGNEADMELWGIDGTGVVKRLRNGLNWANVILDDPITGEYDKVVGVSFNGKLYLFYKSAVNRLHVFDPNLAVPRVRRVGLAAPTAASTGTDTGAGAYAGSRYYRTRLIQLNGIIIVRRSEPGPTSALITPSGIGAAIRVTRPPLPGEGETHWEIEASTDAKTFVVLAGGTSAIDVAAPTSDDSVMTASYTTLTASDPAGMFNLFPAAKFGISDNNRLIMAGSWVTASEPKESRIWYSPVLGSDDKGDDERWVNTATQKNRIDTSEKNGGSITSIVGPINGVFWTMKFRQLWRHVPTGDLITPYITRQISPVIGSINHHGSFLAEDAAGAPAAYIVSHRGLYRLGIEQLTYMGRDVEDVWKGKNGYSKINLSATIPAHAVFHTDEGHIYLWIATGVGDTPNLRLRCDVKQAVRQDKYGLRGGWSVDTGDAANAYCSCLFSNTPGVVMSKDLKPHIGRSDTTVYKCDTTSQTDNGVTFQSYVKTKSIVPAAVMNRLFAVTESYLTADASASVIRQSLIGDFGVNQKNSDQAMDPKKNESIVIKKFGASMQSDQGAIQVQLGDLVAIASTWAVHALLIPVGAQGDK